MTLKQTTARTLFNALHWIHVNPHHESGFEVNADGDYTHFWFRNYQAALRVPCKARWYQEFISSIKPNQRPHDDRMWAVTMGGKRRLTKLSRIYGVKIDRKRHP